MVMVCDFCGSFPAILVYEGCFFCQDCAESLKEELNVKVRKKWAKHERCPICENLKEEDHKCKDKSKDCKKLMQSLPFGRINE